MARVTGIFPFLISIRRFSAEWISSTIWPKPTARDVPFRLCAKRKMELTSSWFSGSRSSSRNDYSTL